MKKLITLFLVLCMALSLVPMTASAEESVSATHEGEEGWTKISTLDELKAIPNEDGKYWLANDIVLPIGEKAYSKCLVYPGDGKITAKITLDGCGHSILPEQATDGALFSSSSVLFFQLNGGAEIMNLTFGSAEKPIVLTTSAANVGIVAGSFGKNLTLTNITVYAKIDDSGRANNNNVGGLVGKGNGGILTLTGCSFHGSYKNTTSHDSKYFGGMLGTLGSSSAQVIAYNCVGDFTVDVPEKGCIGGILGGVDNGSLIKLVGCKNIGTLEAKCNVGGIVGKSNVDFIMGAVILCCSNEGTVTCTDTEGNSVAGEIIANLATVPETVLFAGNCGKEGKALIGNKDDGIGALSLEMVTGAAVTTKVPAALRFRTRISTDDYKMLVELFGEESIAFGTLIAPTADVTAAGAFTKAALTAAGKTFVDDAYVMSGEEKWVRMETVGEGDAATELASFVGKTGELTAADYETAYSGIGYVVLTINGAEYVIYADYDASNSRTVKAVAEAALAEHQADASINNYSNSEQTVLKGFAGAQ